MGPRGTGLDGPRDYTRGNRAARKSSRSEEEGPGEPAGHLSRIDPATHQRADDGRDWATTQFVADEHTIMLLPSWWPAGVSVTLPNRTPALGDTIVGSAFAYIADGRKKVPTAKVWAWRVPCSSRAR